MVRTGLPSAIIKKYGVTKKAWAVFRGRHRRSHATAHSGVKHQIWRIKTKTRSVRVTARRRYFGRRRHHGGGGGIMQTGERLAKVGALLAPYVSAYFEGSTAEHKLDIGLWRLTGYSMGGRKWIPAGLIQGWAPIIGVSLLFRAYHKLNGLLRKA